MDISGTPPSRIQGDDLLLNPGNVTLVFGDKLWFEFPIPVPGHLDLKFAILAFEGFRGMSIALIVRSQIPFLVFSYPSVASSSASISS